MCTRETNKSIKNENKLFMLDYLGPRTSYFQGFEYAYHELIKYQKEHPKLNYYTHKTFA
jgi:hypothetical protein